MPGGVPRVDSLPKALRMGAGGGGVAWVLVTFGVRRLGGGRCEQAREAAAAPISNLAEARRQGEAMLGRQLNTVMTLSRRAVVSTRKR